MPTPADPAAPTPETTPDDTGKAKPDPGGTDKGFDPEKYEAPPQEPPATGDGNNGNGNGDGGGTQAPG